MSYNFDDDPDDLFGNVSTQPVDTGYGTYQPSQDPNTGANYNNNGNNAGTDTGMSALLQGLDPNYQASNQYLSDGAVINDDGILQVNYRKVA